MHQTPARTSVSVTELKRSLSPVLEQADGEPVAVLNHNRPIAYLLPAATYEALIERLDDLELAEIVKSRRTEPVIKINPDDL